MSNRITIYAGNSVSLPVTITEDGSAFDLTDYTMTFTLKEKKSYDSAVLIEVAGVIDVPASGQGLITIPADDTELDVGTYFYEIKVENSSTGDVQTVILDRFIIQQDLT